MKKALNKVVILGIDGLDPVLVDKAIKRGLLPNLKNLKSKGYCGRLKTTEPPQSPVAWASFTTGVKPSKHGVFDFIVRDAKDYSLDLIWSVNLNNLYHARPFWQELGESGIPLKILFLPNTFPPSSLNGEMLSGMGTPDLFGTGGTYTRFTSGNFPKNSHGKEISIKDEDNISANIAGPKKTSVPVSISKITDKKIVIKLQKEKTELGVGEFSDWMKIVFRKGVFSSTSGIVRFYLRSAKPLDLYMSPINHDPERPLEPVGYPKGYSREVARRYGLFSTLGLPHNTFALEEDAFTEEAFLENAQSVFDERKRIFLGELKSFGSGVFFNYVGVTDTIQHMYWRFMNDPKSPYRNVIMDYYQKVDTLVGDTLRLLREEDVLIILSDHGFGSFDYEFNVNGWLKKKGFLFLKNGKKSGGELLSDVDWSKTRAYAIGYNGIYINLKNREGKGIVEAEKYQSLKRLIAKELLKEVNPLTGKSLIKKVHFREDLEIKVTDHRAPDLILGYFKGTRTSWNSAVGGAEKQIFAKRRSKWRGDHLFDSTEVPGVLIINKKVKLDKPEITDILNIVNKFLLAR